MAEVWRRPSIRDPPEAWRDSGGEIPTSDGDRPLIIHRGPVKAHRPAQRAIKIVAMTPSTTATPATTGTSHFGIPFCGTPMTMSSENRALEGPPVDPALNASSDRNE